MNFVPAITAVIYYSDAYLAKRREASAEIARRTEQAEVELRREEAEIVRRRE
jgi:hypothetical protein